MNVTKFNIRIKQAIGAMCIMSFCDKHGIKHDTIKELLNHLLKLLIVEDIPQWNEDGLNIEITGRGDDLPEALLNIIPENLYYDFFELVDKSIEIGIVDLFGAPSELPGKFLLDCLQILDKHNIAFSIPKFLPETDINPWGKPLLVEEYERVIDHVKRYSCNN